MATNETWTVDVQSKKPRMLFVDDRTNRIQYAMEKYAVDYEVIIAANFAEAMRQLCLHDFDVVSLDHDLNGHDFEDTDSPTCGMEIVRYIKKTGWTEFRKKPIFWIHSSNLFAAHLMIVELTHEGYDAWYKGFETKKEHMKYNKEGLPL